VDLLFNLLIVFFLFFVIQIIQEKKKSEIKNLKSKAEFMVTVEWPSDRPDDIDTYFEDPLGGLVHYKSKETPLVNLDRDDVGHRNDQITLPDGTMIDYKENKEVVTIRSIVPGEYVVNIHMFGKEAKNKAPVPVTVTVEKLNPFKTIDSITLLLENNGDRLTAVRFTVDAQGEVTDVNRLDKNLIEIHNAGEIP